MAVGNQDGSGVTMSPAVLLGGLYQPVNLALGQIFAATPVNCYITGVKLCDEPASYPWKWPV